MWFVEKSFSAAHREELRLSCKRLPGFSDLKFDGAGNIASGKQRAGWWFPECPELVVNAIHGRNVVVIEDASHREMWHLLELIPAGGKTNGRKAPAAFVVQIDFADFDQGSRRRKCALEAFNVAGDCFNELDHVVNDEATLLHWAKQQCEASHQSNATRVVIFPASRLLLHAPAPY